MMDIQERNEIITQVIEETINSGFTNQKTINEFGYFKYYISAEDASDDGSNCKNKIKLMIYFFIILFNIPFNFY